MEQLEQEINIRELINTILKRKWLIGAIFSIAVVATALINLGMPKIYEITMVIEPSTIDVAKQGESLKIDSPKNIQAKIESDAFNSKIIQALRLDPSQVRLSFDVSCPNESNLIKVSIKEQERDRELGIRILNALYAELSKSYEEIVDYKKDIFDNEAAASSTHIEYRKQDMAFLKNELKKLEEREDSLIEDLDIAKADLKKLKNISNEAVSEKPSREGSDFLDLSRTIAHNLEYIDSLYIQIANVRTGKAEVVEIIGEIAGDIHDLQSRQGVARLNKQMMRNVKLVQKPEITLDPIGPKRTKNVALAAGASLLFGIFLAFFMEFWEGFKQGQ